MRNRVRKNCLLIGTASVVVLQFYFISDRLSSMRGEIDQLKNSSFLTVIKEKWENLFVYKVPASAWLNELKYDDPSLLDYINKHKVVPIPPESLLTKEQPEDIFRGIGAQLTNILQENVDGFFVECGARERLALSNTFLVESLLGWRGLVIEADPKKFALALEMKRNAYLVPACLSTSTKPRVSYFKTVKVQCLPLHSILLALNKTTVDLFSLDIGGSELDVLLTIPFDKIDIKVMVINFSRVRQGKMVLEDFMFIKGYSIYPSKPSERKNQGWAEENHIFIKKGCGYRATRDDLIDLNTTQSTY